MSTRVELSFVIPVYNGALSIARVVSEIASSFSASDYEVVLVNDGSRDNSEDVCRDLVAVYKGRVAFVQLARNFGEHNAVLCGLRHTSGRYVAVLDDDGQNPPSEVWALYQTCKASNADVVYGRYEDKKHHWFRNFGSFVNDRVANIVLKKPKGLYLSSFKIMTRFMVDEVCRYQGALPYIDGIIFRSTQRIEQVHVKHQAREVGQSNYTLRRLIRLWLSMFINHSVWPLRMASFLGIFTAMASVFLIASIVIEKLTTPHYPIGVPLLLVLVVFFAGLQLLMLGVMGEYLGRMFLDSNGQPQSVVRYVSKFE